MIIMQTQQGKIQIKPTHQILKERVKLAVTALKEKGYDRPVKIKEEILKRYPEYNTAKLDDKMNNVLGYRSTDLQLTIIIEELVNTL